MSAQTTCPLCGAGPAESFAEDRARAYFRCPTCALVFADPARHLEPAAERARYDRHRNDPDDPGYRAHLDRLARPLLTRLCPGLRGLDYGCGPGPLLAQMLTEAGLEMAVYDPFYAPDRDVLATTYDVVTCTETVEHFRHPADDWAQLSALVAAGGWLGVMTKLAVARDCFPTWFYKNDPTHVSFYSLATLAWIGARLALTIELHDEDVVLMRRP